MLESNRTSSILAPVGIVWLISLVVGFPLSNPHSYTTIQPPAQPSRPNVATVASSTAFSRLWEDPLEATGALTFQPFKGKLAEAWTGEEVWAEDDIPSKDEKSIEDLKKIKKAIFVLTKGLRYNDVAEWRRQQRYAVQAALWTKGYSPVQADQLYYQDFSFRTVFGKGPATATVKPGQNWYLRIPYEDYRDEEEVQKTTYGSPEINRVRVFYINLNLINDQPLGAICRLVEVMNLQGKEISLTSPPSTDWLNSMLLEAPSVKATNVTLMPDINVYNSLATGDIEGLSGEKNAVRTMIVSPAAGQHKTIQIHQLIESDTKGIKLIRDEFEIRGLDIGEDDWLKGGPCSVAVVSEWETSFGRKFAKAATKVKKWRGSVVELTYLRGLDGVSPDGRGAGPAPDLQVPGQRAADSRTPGEALGKSIEAPPLPIPFGPSQYDYIARMGETLKRENLISQAAGHGEIRAIGVIGTDINDKLVLLKVLRPRFPNALFFTNEMDAEFLQPENNAFTRNLIVSTRYPIDGLSPSPRGDRKSFGRLPPFRTSAQAATVDSVWAALEGRSYEARPTPSCLYEVGLRQLHQLTESKSPGVSTSSPEPESKDNEAPSSPLWLNTRSSMALILSGLALFEALRVARLRRLRRKPVGPKLSFGLQMLQYLNALDGYRDRLFRRRVLIKPSFRTFLRLLLGKRRPFLETRFLRQLRNGEIAPIPDLRGTSEIGEASHWWFYSAIVVAWGLLWWLTGLEWGSLVVALCGTAGLAWLKLKPRKDHQSIGWLVFGLAGVVLVAAQTGRWTVAQYSGEPWALADGVCLWPAVVLRFIAAGLAVHFVRLAWSDICGLRDDLTRRYFLEREGSIVGGVRHKGEPSPLLVHSKGEGLVPRDFPHHRSLDQGSNPAAGPAPERRNEAAEWEAYLNKSDPRKAKPRVRWSRLTGATLLLTAVAMLVVGFPSADSRGWIAKTGDIASLSAALIGLALLSVLVGDQLWQCRKFIRGIWVHGTTGFGFETEETILLVARLTKGIGDLLVYPFSVCFVLLCAHSRYFERWLGLPGLYAMLALALGMLVALAWKMQRSAHDVRNQTVAYLQLNLAEATWMKRLVLQRVDFIPGKQDHEKDWWTYTLARLGRHVTLPEKLRTLDAFEKSERGQMRFGPESDEAVQAARASDVTFHEARIRRIEQLIAMVSSIKEGAFGGLQDNPIVRGFSSRASGWEVWISSKGFSSEVAGGKECQRQTAEKNVKEIFLFRTRYIEFDPVRLGHGKAHDPTEVVDLIGDQTFGQATVPRPSRASCAGR